MKEVIDEIFNSENEEIVERIEQGIIILNNLKNMSEKVSKEILDLHEKIFQKEENIKELEQNIKQVEELIQELRKDLHG